jgi:hypothetical protein
MSLTPSLTKEFRATVAAMPFFRDWEQTSPREYRSEDNDVRLRIDLQLDKWWQKSGGMVAVNLWCGHKWNVPTLGWLDEGFDYSDARLSPRENQDHWWQIQSDADVQQFGIDVERLLFERGVPWFEKVSSKEGFLAWYASANPQPATFPYVLEIYGPTKTKQRVRDWLATAPPGIDRYLKWLVKAGIISHELSERIHDSSIQAAATYRHEIQTLLREI